MFLAVTLELGPTLPEVTNPRESVRGFALSTLPLCVFIPYLPLLRGGPVRRLYCSIVSLSVSRIPPIPTSAFNSRVQLLPFLRCGVSLRPTANIEPYQDCAELAPCLAHLHFAYLRLGVLFFVCCDPGRAGSLASVPQPLRDLWR